MKSIFGALVIAALVLPVTVTAADKPTQKQAAVTCPCCDQGQQGNWMMMRRDNWDQMQKNMQEMHQLMMQGWQPPASTSGKP